MSNWVARGFWPWRVCVVVAFGVLLIAHGAELPNFAGSDKPAGWELKGEALAGAVVAAAKGTLVLTTEQELALPLELRLAVRLPQAQAMMSVQILGQDAAAKPLLESRLLLGETVGRAMPPVTISAVADGLPLATEAKSSRGWSRPTYSGTQRYTWRFPEVRNLWDERDRVEIGRDLARMVPFGEKVFNYRLVLTESGRQVWLDGRLVAEALGPTTGPVKVRLQVARGGAVVSCQMAEPKPTASFQVLDLAAWSTDRESGTMQEVPGQPVPLSMVSQGSVDLV